MIFGGGEDEQLGFFDLVEVDGVFVEADLECRWGYFVVLFVFPDEFLEVGAGVADFLFAGVEYDLCGGGGYHFLTLGGHLQIRI